MDIETKVLKIGRLDEYGFKPYFERIEAGRKKIEESTKRMENAEFKLQKDISRIERVFRCAVYYAEHTKHDPDKLKWWNWKDK